MPLVSCRFAGETKGDFQGAALGDLSYRAERLANAGNALGITDEAIAAAATVGSFHPASAGWLNGRSPA